MKNIVQAGRNLLLPLLVNILVMIMLGILFQLALHFFPGLRRHSNMLWTLGLISLVMGMGGAFISLLASRWMAKAFNGVQVVDPNTNHPELRELVRMVHGYSQRAGLPEMPEVGIYESPEVNAFATGPSRSSSLVAVSTGLLRQMNRAEAEGVIAHEVAHIANGDMVTMTLVQGVMNAFVFFFAHLLGSIAAQALRGNRDEERDHSSFGDFMIQSLLINLFQMLFGALAMVVVCWFSRKREFRADAGSALLAGKDRMISALRALQRIHGQPINVEEGGNYGFEALKISGKSGGLLALFSTHPPLEERIAYLESLGR